MDSDSSGIDLKIEELPQRFCVLAPGAVAAFAAACAERLYVFYETFSADTGCGDAERLRGLLNDQWRVLLGEVDAAKSALEQELRKMGDKLKDSCSELSRLLRGS